VLSKAAMNFKRMICPQSVLPIIESESKAIATGNAGLAYSLNHRRTQFGQAKAFFT